jgi:hypothetical protein
MRNSVGLIVNLVIWNKRADIKKILIGGSLISLALNEYVNKRNIRIAKLLIKLEGRLAFLFLVLIQP